MKQWQWQRDKNGCQGLLLLKWQRRFLCSLAHWSFCLEAKLERRAKPGRRWRRELGNTGFWTWPQYPRTHSRCGYLCTVKPDNIPTWIGRGSQAPPSSMISSWWPQGEGVGFLQRLSHCSSPTHMDRSCHNWIQPVITKLEDMKLGGGHDRGS